MEAQVRVIESESGTLRDALLHGARVLLEAGIENGRLDAEVLLRHVLKVEPSELYINMDSPLDHGRKQQFRELLAQRARLKPVAYITGRKEFWSLDFIVTPDVLIPRPATEVVVEIALQQLRRSGQQHLLKGLDLGTGSGAIAICLAKECAGIEIKAVDISSRALAVARLNSERHGLAKRIQFLRGDLFEPVAGEEESFDLIVSNPPYVRKGELPTIAPGVREWEPMLALDGGVDGLDFYRRIIGRAHEYLTVGGHIVLEIGADMAKSVAALFSAAGCYAPICVYQDYAGWDRVIAATKLLPHVAWQGMKRG